MPEPDFNQIAQQLVIDGWRVQDARTAIVEQLRQAWNTRGAADRALVDEAATAVAPEPPALGMAHMTDVSIRKARRDWWREGFVAGARATAQALDAVDPQAGSTGKPTTRV